MFLFTVLRFRILITGDGLTKPNEYNLLVEGTNAPTWAAGVNDSIKDYVTAYSDITAGTTTTTGSTVAAVTTNRTGW